MIVYFKTAYFHKNPNTVTFNHENTYKTHSTDLGWCMIPNLNAWMEYMLNHMNPSIVTYNNEGTYETLPDKKALG